MLYSRYALALASLPRVDVRRPTAGFGVLAVPLAGRPLRAPTCSAVDAISLPPLAPAGAELLMLVSLLAGLAALVTERGEHVAGDVIVEDVTGVVSVGAELAGPPLQGLLEAEAEAEAAAGINQRNKRTSRVYYRNSDWKPLLHTFLLWQKDGCASTKLE